MMEQELRRHSQHLEELVKSRTSELAISEEKYHKLADNTSDVVFTINLDGRLTYVNPSAENVTRYTAAQLLNMGMKQLVAPEDYPRILERRNARIQGEKNLPPIEFDLVKADKSRATVEMNTSPTYNEAGKLVGIQGTLRDVTERKHVEDRLRDSEAKFRGIAEGSFDPIITLDLEGCITYASPAWFFVTGYEAEEVVGKHFTDFMQEEEHEKKIETLGRAVKGEVVRAQECQILRRDGSVVHTEFTASPIVESGLVINGVEVIVRDVTERRRLVTLKEQFISSVTHELRTPLVSISGYLDLVLKNERFEKETVSYLEVIKRNSDRLLSLTNDLLDFQRLQLGKLEVTLKPIDFMNVLDNSIKEIKPMINGRRQDLEVDIPKAPIRILGDTVRLTQVVMNVLDNASKFTPDGGRISVHVEDRVDQVIIQVSDSGIGIRGEDLHRVFEPFASIKKPTYIKGTGLGLSVTKGLIETHGGTITVQSEGEGRGSTFTFTLPKEQLSRDKIQARTLSRGLASIFRKGEG
jgi:PAS domain S-box-containing protein